MPRRKFIAYHKDMIAAYSSSNNTDDHKSLGSDQEQAPEAQTSTHDMGSSSAISQHRGGPFILKSISP
jgi:hypothetical protein